MTKRSALLKVINNRHFRVGTLRLVYYISKLPLGVGRHTMVDMELQTIRTNGNDGATYLPNELVS